MIVQGYQEVLSLRIWSPVSVADRREIISAYAEVVSDVANHVSVLPEINMMDQALFAT